LSVFFSCYKCFTDEQALLEHIPKHKESKHLKVHICPYCGKSYTQQTYLAKHMTKHADRRNINNFVEGLEGLNAWRNETVAASSAPSMAAAAAHGHFNAGIQASVLSAANQSAAAAATSSATSAAAAAACTYPSAAAAASTAAANQMMVNDPSAFRINMAAFGRTLGTSRSYFPFDNPAFKSEAQRPAG
uniref:C2H2-type domain-containing protein n=1 Tax=Gongylonema pulchrum TaxID=637853 RepID=A0A183CVY5_9BILA